MAETTLYKIALERIEEAARTGASSLDLSRLWLTALPIEIAKLTNLTVLDVGDNQLTFLPSEIGELVNLTFLKLSINKLTTLPAEIGKLSKLEAISIGSNKLISLPIEITKLKNLTWINLSLNQLTSLFSEIGQIENLKNLILSSNRFVNLPSEIWQLNNLVSLDLSLNDLTSLPNEIRYLTNLTLLDLSCNQLTNLPPGIGELANLETLILSNRTILGKSESPGNKIKNLPLEIQNLKQLKKLDLRDNHLDIPPEILEKIDEPQVILNYYKDVFFSLDVKGIDPRQFLKPNSELDIQEFDEFIKNAEKRIARPINEIKLLIVGQGSVGKTSIVQRVLCDEFDQNQTKTEGISINQWLINDIKHNIWDFGGQEIMHATHQFFLTKRSLYLLVLDSRLTQEENRVEYWLKIIQSFSDESPVLIVGNKIDQHPLDIDRTGLQKKYPNIVCILETSAATGTGIEELKAAITEQVNNLPHVRDLLPETWFTVKTKLETLGKQSNFITHDKYLELCAENEVSDETSQRTLIGFLHDLGVVLHFQDDPRLEALGILNPQWVTNGVYKILNSHALFQNKGVLTTSMLDEILNLPDYPRGKRLFIVDMMKKFELCYDIEPDKTFLVPDLLPKDQPDLKFNGVPAFEYAYPVLPSSVVTRFIVRMNQKIEDGLVWRTGVVLKIGENKALVKADIEDKKITIAIDGLEYTRRDALSAIRYELGEIHNSIKGLNPQQRVPIPSAPNAEPLEYEYLLMLEREGDETCRVKDGSRLVTVNVRQLLSGIESESLRRNAPEGSVIIHGDVYTGGGDFSGRDKSISTGDHGVVVSGKVGGHLIAGDDNQVIQNSYNKIAASEIDPELKQTMQLLIEAVAAMNRELPPEKVAEVEDDLGELVEEVTRPTPRQKWYSVSVEGLIKAAENLDKLGTPVISLAKKVLALLTGRASQ